MIAGERAARGFPTQIWGNWVPPRSAGAERSAPALDSNHIFEALSSGATGYLMKNTPARELLAAIREIHSGGSPMAGNIARKIIQTFQAPVPEPAAAEADPLTAREKQVLQLLAEGQLYKEIAETLQVSVPTVCTHIRRIYEKLHVRSRAQAVARFLKQSGGQGRNGAVS